MLKKCKLIVMTCFISFASDFIGKFDAFNACYDKFIAQHKLLVACMEQSVIYRHQNHQKRLVAFTYLLQPVLLDCWLDGM